MDSGCLPPWETKSPTPVAAIRLNIPDVGTQIRAKKEGGGSKDSSAIHMASYYYFFSFYHSKCLEFFFFFSPPIFLVVPSGNRSESLASFSFFSTVEKCIFSFLCFPAFRISLQRVLHGVYIWFKSYPSSIWLKRRRRGPPVWEGKRPIRISFVTPDSRPE